MTPLAPAGTTAPPATGIRTTPPAGTMPAGTPSPVRVSATRTGETALKRVSTPIGTTGGPGGLGFGTASLGAGGGGASTKSNVTQMASPSSTTPTPTRL